MGEPPPSSAPHHPAAGPATPPALRARALARSFGRGRKALAALGPVDTEIAPGECVCVVGPSGCGKSTLLRIAAGLLRPSAGELELRVSAGRPAAMIFQDSGIYDWKTVLGNVRFGLDLQRVPRREADERARSRLARMGLADFAGAYPAALSGGTRRPGPGDVRPPRPDHRRTPPAVRPPPHRRGPRHPRIHRPQGGVVAAAACRGRPGRPRAPDHRGGRPRMTAALPGPATRTTGPPRPTAASSAAPAPGNCAPDAPTAAGAPWRSRWPPPYRCCSCCCGSWPPTGPGSTPASTPPRRRSWPTAGTAPWPASCGRTSGPRSGASWPAMPPGPARAISWAC